MYQKSVQFPRDQRAALPSEFSGLRVFALSSFERPMVRPAAMRAHHISIQIALLVVACGDAPTDPNPPLDPPPPEGGQQLATESFRLEPGDEKYMCYQFYAPSERVGITRVEAISMPGVHHIGLFQAFGRDESPEPHECDTLIKQTWLPIWASGTGSPFLQLPADAGFIIEPGTQYIIQLHLQNATDKVMNIRGGLNLTYDRNVDALQPAGMFAFGTFDMEVPANAADHQVPVADCTTGKDMNVFAVFPHMHKYGTKLTMSRTVGSAATTNFYTIDPWTFGDQPMDPLDATVGPDDRFDLTCHYDNPTGETIPYGESSNQEMCFFVMFYYPYSGLGGCVTGG
jgi:hypothetical protein